MKNTIKITERSWPRELITSFSLFLFLLTQSSLSFGQITRSQIIANAVPYTTYTWTASSCNRWLGTSCGGKNVYRAPWVVVGTNTSMPYMWGGWSTTADHTTAMANCRSAGDVCSTNGGGCSGGGSGVSQQCASGHDCSGLVSRAWALTSKQSTTTLPNFSTTISLSQTQPGDMLNLSGSHTRLVETNYGNGSYRVIEASGTDWKVAYHTYTASQLSSYNPRCYNPVCGTSMSQLQLQSAITYNPNPIQQNCPITGAVTIRNTGSSSWTGKLYIALHNSSTTFLGDIDSTSNNVTIGSNSNYIFNFSKSSIVSPPQNVQLWVKYKTSGSSAYPLVPQGNYTNPLNTQIISGSCTNCPAGGYCMSNTAVTTCSGTFYDSGGNSDYSDNQSFTKTFTPSTSGQMVRVAFSSFATESCCDYLKIYNGPTTTSSQLIGQYQGNNSPGTVTASNSTGQLTFQWVSDGSVVAPGWQAAISCVAPCNAPSAPVATTGSNVTVNSFRANWNSVNGATGYFLDVSTNANFTSFVVQNYSIGNVLNATVSNLNCGTTYYYRVRASNTCGTSSSSNTISVATAACCTAPTFTSCPTTVAASTSNGTCSAAVSYNAVATGSPNPALTFVLTGATTGSGNGTGSGYTFNKGTTSVAITATNTCASTVCNFTVVVSDNQAPTISCPANTTRSSTNGICGAVVNYNVGSGDNCAGSTLAQTGGYPSGSTFPVGVTVNSFTATDAQGNSTNCSFTVTVNDNANPTITCPTNIVASNDNGICGAVRTFAINANDNCAGFSTAQNLGLASGSLFPIGVTTNSFTVTDASGRTASCSFTVTVLDNQNPTINCPANIIVNNDNGVCGALVNYSIASTDNCVGQNVVQSAGLASGSMFPIGVTTNSFTVTDASGHTASCSFTVTVLDNQNPMINCPANIIVNNDNGVCGALVNYSITSTDNCVGQNLVQSAGLASGSTFPIGTTSNSFTVTDQHSNMATCSFIVTVNDNEAPIAVCQNVMVTLNSSGTASTTSSAVNNGSSDNCGIGTMILSPTTFSCVNAGNNNALLTITDVNGNSASCIAVVTVIAPQLNATLYADTTACGYNLACHGASNGVAHVNPIGGCPPYSYLWSNGSTNNPVSGLSAGLHHVLILDASGNTYEDSLFLIAPPLLALAIDSISGPCLGTSTGEISISAQGGNDCAPYSYQWSNGATSQHLNNLPAGNLTVTVSDVNGCVATQTVTINVLPTFTPTFTTVGNILSSDNTWAGYQWTLNGSPITGANAASYMVTQAGWYGLNAVDTNGCAGIGVAVFVSLVGLADAILEDGLTVSPNPTQGLINIQFEGSYRGEVNISLYDLLGQKLLDQTMDKSVDGFQVEIDLSNYANAPYFFILAGKEWRYTRKILKN